MKLSAREYYIPLTTVAVFFTNICLARIQINGGSCAHLASFNAPRPMRSVELSESELQRYVEAYPKDFRPLGEFFAAQIRTSYVSQTRLEEALKIQFQKLITSLPEDDSIPLVVYGGQQGMSNWWVSMLFYEFLRDNSFPKTANRQIEIFDSDYSSEFNEFIQANGSAWVALPDEAAYSGVQLANPLNGLARFLPQNQIQVLLGFATNFAVTESLQKVAPEAVILYDKEKTMPTLGELLVDEPELKRLAARVLAPRWESSVLFYFDHTFADFKSTATIDGTDRGRILIGAVPNETGGILRHVPFLTQPDNPYRNWLGP